MLLYPSANRDEDVFDDPFRFDSARSPNEHVAFGFGTHFCLGASLARLEIAVMLDELLTRTPDPRHRRPRRRARVPPRQLRQRPRAPRRHLVTRRLWTNTIA